MATGGYEELAEELQCPVCYEEMDKPKVLNCRHVFCDNCLKKLLYDDKIPCPLCKQVQKIERTSGIEGLPEPLILNNLQEIITRFLTINKDTGKITKTCLHCSKSAAYFCQDCGEYMCSSCQTEHSQDLITEEHSITLLSKWTLCMKHGGKLIIGYCKDCKAGLCMQCTNNKSEHSKHAIVNINDKVFLDKRKRTLQNSRDIHLSGKYQFDVTNYRSDLQKDMREIDEGARNSLLKLENLITVIEEMKQKIQQEAAAEKKKIGMHISELDDFAATQNSLCSFINEIIDRNSAPEIVIAVDELPDFSIDTTPVRHACKVPMVRDTIKIKQKLLDLKLPSGGPCGSTSLKAEVRSDCGYKAACTDDWPSSMSYKNTWEVKLERVTSDVMWDEQESVWWLRTANSLYKYRNDGTKLLAIDRGVLGSYGKICLDLKRRWIVTCFSKRVLGFAKSGSLAKSLTVSESNCLSGVTYCSHRDVYVLSDVGKHCLWFTRSNNGQVLQRFGSKGTADTQFNHPYHICCKTVSSDMCHVIVSDHGNNCIKIFTHDGDFIRKLGSHGPGDFQLSQPYGVCVDQWDRIIVCDNNSRRIVCFSDGNDERISVLIPSTDLMYEYPYSLGITQDSHTICVGFSNSFTAYEICI